MTSQLTRAISNPRRYEIVRGLLATSPAYIPLCQAVQEEDALAAGGVGVGHHDDDDDDDDDEGIPNVDAKPGKP